MLDIITVGSATVDVFVNILKKQQEVVNHHHHTDLCYHLGTKVLIESLHTDTGGGGTNTAVAFSRLGLKTGWLGVLGEDEHANIIEKQLKKEKITILGPKKKGMSGYSVIFVGVEKDHVILAYKGINDQLKVKDLHLSKLKPKWFYFSSMMGESLGTLKRIANIAYENKIPYAFNPSMYLTYGPENIKPILEGCSVLILNREEAQSLLGSVREEEHLLKELRKLTKGIVVITNGEHGSYAYNGTEMLWLKPRKCDVVETTGAGDAFASGFVAGLIMKKSMDYCLQMGQAEASSVIAHIGAKEKLLTLREANRLIKKAPSQVVKL